MSDKEKDIQLKEKEAEKVSGGVPYIVQATIPIAGNTEETKEDTTPNLGCVFPE